MFRRTRWARATGQIAPEAMLIFLAAAMVYFVGQEVVDGAKWVGKETKKAGHAIVHVLKKL